MWINDKGQVIVFGDNYYGQLGLGHREKIKIPQMLPNLLNIIYVSKGSRHTLFLTNEGEVYSCGNNCSGQLGLGHNNDVLTPNKIALEVENAFQPHKCLLPQVSNPSGKIIYICCGKYHSMCIDENYNLYAFGDNNDYQLGLKHYNNVFIPIKCDIKAIKVFCGPNYTLIIDINEKIYVSGGNSRGQLGLGNNKAVNTWTELKFEMSKRNKVKDITCGYLHTLILTADGYVYSFGFNHDGQLGLGNNEDKYEPQKINIENIVKISSGFNHNLFLDCDGNVYSFGNNEWGQLGLNNKIAVNIPTKILPHTKWQAASSHPSERMYASTFASIVDIFCYNNNSFIHDGASIFCFGENEDYNLGLGHNEEIIIPTLNPYLTDISHFGNSDNKRFMNTKSSRKVF